MTVQPSPAPPTCWFCGYNLAGARTPLCPECGSDQAQRPPVHRIRRGGGAFTSIVGFIALVGLLYLDAVGLGGPLNMGRLGALAACAAIPGLNALRLMFLPPLAVDERTTSQTAFWLCIVSGCAASVVLLV